MNCREFVDFLMGYLEDELPDEQTLIFREHMRECPRCETYLDTYRETVRLGKSFCSDPEAPVPADVPEALVEAILVARRVGGN